MSSFNSDNVASQHPGTVNEVFKELLQPEQSGDFDERFNDIMRKYNRLPEQERHIVQTLFGKAFDHVINAYVHSPEYQAELASINAKVWREPAPVPKPRAP